MKPDKELADYLMVEEMQKRLERNTNPWSYGYRRDFDRMVAMLEEYNRATDFQEYIPEMTRFDKLVLKGKMTDSYK